jgi:RNA polymerase sigma-70 factor (ECF subfamily)
MVGTRTWFSGRLTCLRYHRDCDGIHRAFGLGILTTTDAGIARIVVFGGGPVLVAKFGLPSVHPGLDTPPGACARVGARHP